MKLERYQREVKQLIQAGAYAEAEALMQGVHDRLQHRLAFLLLYNDLYRSKQDLNKAIKSARKIITHCPSDPDGYCRLAQDLLKARQAKKAAKIIEKGVKLFPTDFWMLWTAINTYRALPNIPKAIACGYSLVEHHPARIEGYINLVRDLERSGAAKEAIRVLETLPSSLSDHSAYKEFSQHARRLSPRLYFERFSKRPSQQHSAAAGHSTEQDPGPPLILHNSHAAMGHTWSGNSIFKYLVLHNIASRLKPHRSTILSNFSLDPWCLHHPSVEAKPGEAIITINDQQKLDQDFLCYTLAASKVSRVEFSGYLQRVENLPSVSTCRSLFKRQDIGAHKELLKDSILCHIRAGDILAPIHPHYLLLPVEYYQCIAEETGKKLVFCGQLGDDPYSLSIRNAFPNSTIIPQQDKFSDFQLMMHAEEAILSVSTFAWLAVWMSEAKRIYMPVLGMYNNVQDPATNLIPIHDTRYVYDMFPYAHTTEVSKLRSEHSKIIHEWTRVGINELLEANFASRGPHGDWSFDYAQVPEQPREQNAAS